MIDRPIRQTIYFIRQNPVMLLSLGAVVFLFVVCIYSISAIYKSSQRIISNHTQSRLESTVDQLTAWQNQNIRMIEVIKNSRSGTSYLGHFFEEKAQVELKEEFENWLYPLIIPLGFEGYLVADVDRRIVASSSKNFIGVQTNLAVAVDLYERTLQNNSAMSAPFFIDSMVDGPEGRLPPGILFHLVCTSIYANKNPVGFFCLRLNPQERFFPIFYGSRTGSTGEAYAVDRLGKIISPSRFDDSKNIEVGYGNHARWLTPLYANSQSTNADDQQITLSPLTNRVINNGLQKVLFAYSNYRGKQVIGVGRWVEELNFGVIVEQETEEALKPYAFTRRLVFLLSLCSLAMIIILTASAVLHRRSMAKREIVFRSLLDNIPTPIYLMSQSGKVKIVNPSLCELLQLGVEDIVDKWPDEINIQAHLQRLFAEKYSVNSGFYEDETIEIDVNGKDLKYFRVIRFPVKEKIDDHIMEVRYFATVLVDVTDRIVASSKLEEINLKLERLVDERTKELIVARDRAEEASNAKAEFLANVSHEIRTPLNAIIGLAHVALAVNKDSEVSTFLEKMRSSGQHLLRVINDILNFSRLEAGKLELDSTNFLLEDLVDNVVDMVWDKAHSKNIEIDVHIAPGVPHTLKGDPLRLGQILINFMANAVKFTEQGKVQFSVVLRSEIEGFATLEFNVNDTGIGIPKEKLEKLFQPFRQIDSSSTRKFEGSGLGLAICKDLADLMGGIIEVESEHGVGSCFRLLITMENLSNSNAYVPSLKSDSLKLKKPRRINANILLVEDNELNQEVAEALLKMNGCHVSTVSSGFRAIELMKQEDNDIDVILMDIQMPNMDGVEATGEIRKIAHCEYIPIIAMTANVLSGDRERYLNSGMDDYIAKPIDPEHLISTLQKWVNEEKLESESDTKIENGVKDTGSSTMELPAVSQAPELGKENLDNTNSHAGFPSSKEQNSGLEEDTKSNESRLAEKPANSTSPKVNGYQDKIKSTIPFLMLKEEGVDIDSALHNVMGNTELYTKLLKRFVEERSDFNTILEKYLSEENLELALNEVHALGSLAGTLGLNELMGVARKLEYELKENHYSRSSVDTLNKQVENDIAIIQAWLFLVGESQTVEL